jgi:hypothetical protein
MSTTTPRWGVLACAFTGAVLALTVLSGCGNASKTTSNSSTSTGPGNSTATTAAPAAGKQIVVRHGKPVGGVQDIDVKKGGQVRFTVMSDVADEVHVHGYDFHKDVAKNGSVSFDFPAKIDGGFVVELEKRGEQIAALKVQP